MKVSKLDIFESRKKNKNLLHVEVEVTSSFFMYNIQFLLNFACDVAFHGVKVLQHLFVLLLKVSDYRLVLLIDFLYLLIMFYQILRLLIHFFILLKDFTRLLSTGVFAIVQLLQVFIRLHYYLVCYHMILAWFTLNRLNFVLVTIYFVIIRHHS